MASTGISANAVFRGNIFNLLSEAQPIRRSPSTPSLSSRLVWSLRSDGRSDRRVFANARQCAERSSETASDDLISVNGARSFPRLVQSEIVRLPASREGNEGACEEHLQALLQRSVKGLADLSAREAFAISGDITEADMGETLRVVSGRGRSIYQRLSTTSVKGLADLSALEAFAISGDITEADMERLLESLVAEGGQSIKDYRQRAISFGKVAEFLKEGRTYSTPKEEYWPDATEIARTVQVIVDVVPEGEGRSATDYNCRAQLFAKSAEVFPFDEEIRTS